MARKRREAGNLELIGGQLCLDFTNTYTQTEVLQHEYLHRYSDLLAWSRHAGLLDDAQTQQLQQVARQDSPAAATVFERATALRGIIYHLFVAVAHQQSPPETDIMALNNWLAEAPGRPQLTAAGSGFVWQWRQEAHTLDTMLWPIAWSAADLLTSSDLPRVRQCARSEGCDWLFVDSSKNQSRRWCSMKLCGSRDKTRRYYQRKRGGGGVI
jgi:predicted RNA-binding Zn ribbon-like protein